MFGQGENWDLKRSGEMPLYIQIVEAIRGRIASGEWPVGSRIPSQRELASLFKVNRSTIVTAVQELASMGFLEGKSGGGTVVVNNTWSLLSSNPPPNWNNYVAAGEYLPNKHFVREINRAEFIPGMIRLGTAEPSPEMYPLDKIRQLLLRMDADNHNFGYEEPRGSLALRQEICNYLQGYGIRSTPASVMVVSGSLQALHLISVGLLHRGALVLMEKPSYLSSVRVFQSAGMHMQGFPLDDEGIDINLLRQGQRHHKGDLLYTIPSYHNPTGLLMGEKRRKELLELCSAERLPIIEDDAYRELWMDEPPPAPLKALDKAGIVLHIGSLSKQFCPGFRIGWIVGPESVLDRLSDIKMQMDYGSSSLSQQAATLWFSSGMYRQHAEDVRSNLRERRYLTLDILEKKYADIADWNNPAGGFFVWLRLKKDISMLALFEACLRKNILINPGSIYEDGPSDHIRLSYAYPSLSELTTGLTQLADIIRNLGK